MNKIILLLICIVGTNFGNAFGQFEKEYEDLDFSRVLLKGAAEFNLIPSTVNKVVIETDSQEVLEYVTVDNNGDLLTIDLTSKNKKVGKLFSEMEVDVYFKQIDFIELNGAGSLESNGVIKADRIRAELSGSGKVEIEVECDYFDGYMHGTSVFEVEGTAREAFIKLDGVGKFDASRLKTIKTDVNVNGVGGAIVNAKEYLRAQLNGVGSIKYVGNPEIKQFDQNGLGNIKPFDE